MVSPRNRHKDSEYPFSAPSSVDTMVAGMTIRIEFQKYGWMPVQCWEMQ